MKLIDTKSYTKVIDTQKEAENCRLLFLSVIYQAILDSAKKDKYSTADLPQVIYTDWWRQLFVFAGIEGELENVNKIIVSNCNSDKKFRGHHKRFRVTF